MLLHVTACCTRELLSGSYRQEWQYREMENGFQGSNCPLSPRQKLGRGLGIVRRIVGGIWREGDDEIDVQNE